MENQAVYTRKVDGLRLYALNVPKKKDTTLIHLFHVNADTFALPATRNEWLTLMKPYMKKYLSRCLIGNGFLNFLEINKFLSYNYVTR